MAIIDVVRFDGLKSRDWLIYKYPSEKLVLGSQLIVQEGQTALFVKGHFLAGLSNGFTFGLGGGAHHKGVGEPGDVHLHGLVFPHLLLHQEFHQLIHKNRSPFFVIILSK